MPRHVLCTLSYAPLPGHRSVGWHAQCFEASGWRKGFHSGGSPSPSPLQFPKRLQIWIYRISEAAGQLLWEGGKVRVRTPALSMHGSGCIYLRRCFHLSLLRCKVLLHATALRPTTLKRSDEAASLQIPYSIISSQAWSFRQDTSPQALQQGYHAEKQGCQR